MTTPTHAYQHPKYFICQYSMKGIKSEEEFSCVGGSGNENRQWDVEKVALPG
jgi:hypothetical protein